MLIFADLLETLEHKGIGERIHLRGQRGKWR